MRFLLTGSKPSQPSSSLTSSISLLCSRMEKTLALLCFDELLENADLLDYGISINGV
jgi:hypothetical protein